MGVTLFGIGVLAYETMQIITSSLLQSLVNGPWCVCVIYATVFSENPENLHVRSKVIICKYFIFMSENNLLANVLYYIISDVK